MSAARPRSPAPRLQAARALQQVVDGQRSIDAALTEVPDSRDRPLVQELVYGSARWYQQLDAIAAQLLQKPLKPKDRDIHMLLVVGLYQLRHLNTQAHAAVHETVEAAGAKPWARGLLNACLRRAQREADSFTALIDADVSLRTSHPSWLVERLRQEYPERWEQILAANNERPPFHLRVNLHRISRSDYLARLADAGVAARPLETGDTGIVLERPVGVSALPGFADGLVSVQDGAAQWSASLLDLAPGQRVLDACAAPGGKATHILEHQPDVGSLVMVEQGRERAGLIEDNLHRLGFSGEVHVADATAPSEWWDGQVFQRILLDAPCSATGVIRRHPDIKLHRTPQQVRQAADLQAKLLRTLWPLLERGGKLLYVTCSVLSEENGSQVDGFLARTADAASVRLPIPGATPQANGVQLLPGQQGGDGFYYACLAKS